jgi:hypothetical protein
VFGVNRLNLLFVWFSFSRFSPVPIVDTLNMFFSNLLSLLHS